MENIFDTYDMNIFLYGGVLGQKTLKFHWIQRDFLLQEISAYFYWQLLLSRKLIQRKLTVYGSMVQKVWRKKMMLIQKCTCDWLPDR